MSHVVRLAVVVWVSLVLGRGASASVSDEAPVADAAAPVQNQDTPRNAAFQFITLAREGRWDEAAGLLQWPHGQEMGEVTP
ncbi:MAG: hypothetical protein RLZZ217_1001, partial [Planctomycetota bacterium]